MKKKNAINILSFIEEYYLQEKTQAPSSSCSLPYLYIQMQKCMQVFCKRLTLIASAPDI